MALNDYLELLKLGAIASIANFGLLVWLTIDRYRDSGKKGKEWHSKSSV